MGRYKQSYAGKNAVIAQNQASFGMARMFEMVVERYGISFSVFHTEEDARAWLDEGSSESG